MGPPIWRCAFLAKTGQNPLIRILRLQFRPIPVQMRVYGIPSDAVRFSDSVRFRQIPPCAPPRVLSLPAIEFRPIKSKYWLISPAFGLSQKIDFFVQLLD